MTATRTTLLTAAFSLAAAIATFSATVFTPATWQWMTWFQPTVTITAPRDGENFDDSVIVRGEEDLLRAGEVLWAFMHPVASGKYYPATGPCTSTSDEFTCPALFLGPFEAKSPGFEVVVVRADAAAVAQIYGYAVEAPRGQFPGMDSLPGIPGDKKLLNQRE